MPPHDEGFASGPDQAAPEQIVQSHHKAKTVRAQIVIGAEVHGVTGTEGGHREESVIADLGQYRTAGRGMALSVQAHRGRGRVENAVIVLMKVVNQVAR